MSQSQLLVLLLGAFLGAVQADYILTVHLASLHNPAQFTVESSCCVEPLGNQTVCSAPCNTTLRICVRDDGFDQANVSCPITELIVAAQSNGEWRAVIPGAWMGAVQLYITVINDLTASLGPLAPGVPVVGELIDSIFIEQLSLSPSSPLMPPANYTGRFGIATAEVSFSVACTYQFFGPACDVFCPLGRNDSLGRYHCDSNGSRVCLKGYKDITSNCIICVPAENCSDIGGFCHYPGECVCHEGYTGPACSENNSTVTPSTTPLTPSLLLPILAPSTLFPTLTSSTLSRPLLTASTSSRPLPTFKPSSSSNQFSSTTITFGETTSCSSKQILSTTSRMEENISATMSSFTSAVVTAKIVSASSSSISSHLSSAITKTSAPSPVPPTAGLALPSSPPSPNPISLVLGSILGVLLMMILLSVIVFCVSLTLSCWKRNKSKKAKRKLNKSRVHRSRPVETVLVNMAATSHSDIATNSHSELDQSLEELPDTLNDPSYSTFLDESGTLTQETQLETDELSDGVSALEVGTHRKHNLASLEHSLELRFQEVEMSIGEDLLGSIQHSLSQAGGYNVKRLSNNNEHSDSVDTGSDYAPSFIYRDLFVEENNSAFQTPSLSPDNEPPP